MPKWNLSFSSSRYLKRTGSFWLNLIGDPALFHLESRIFHSISLALILLAVVYIPYNLFAGLHIASFSALIIALFFTWQYFNSRFLGKAHNSTLFGFFGVLVFGVNYFFNSGIHGSTDLIWPAYLLLIFAISPYNQHLKWLVIYITCFFLLHVLEFLYPQWVKYPFSAGKGQFIDRVTAFPMPVFAIYIVTRFIRRSHDKEREAAEEKTLAVEASKQQIVSQKQQLEKSNAEKTKLMSIISHDLRTPLINIQNYLQLLQEHDLDSTERPMLEGALLSTTDSAVEMLSNLLHWSKSQMEGAQVNLQKLNVLNVLLGTFEMQKLNAQKKDIRLSYDVADDLTVVGDVDMFQLVIRNLISNAVKFTPQGGAVHIDAEVELNECKITVIDSGNGVSDEQYANLFSIKSAPSLGTNKEKGVGLGLALCKEFVELQGGRIGYEPNKSGGSNFYIYLPKA